MSITKKTAYLIVFATLIITVIGASFAYFTTDLIDGEETVGIINTATCGQIEYVTNVPEEDGILPGWEGEGRVDVHWTGSSTCSTSYSCIVRLEEDSYDENIYIRIKSGADGVFTEEMPLTKEGIEVSRGTLEANEDVLGSSNHEVKYDVVFKEIGVAQNIDQGKSIKLYSTCLVAPIEPENFAVKLKVNNGYITSSNETEEIKKVFTGGTARFEVMANLGYDIESAHLVDDSDFMSLDEIEDYDDCFDDYDDNEERICYLNDEEVDCTNERFNVCFDRENSEEYTEEETKCQVKYDEENGVLVVSATEVTENITCEVDIPRAIYEYYFTSNELPRLRSAAPKAVFYGEEVSETFTSEEVSAAGYIAESALVYGDECELNGTTASAVVHEDGHCELAFDPKKYNVIININGSTQSRIEAEVEHGRTLAYNIEPLENYTTDGFSMNADIDFAEEEISGCTVIGNRVVAYAYSDYDENTCVINLPTKPNESDIAARYKVKVECDHCIAHTTQTIDEDGYITVLATQKRVNGEPVEEVQYNDAIYSLEAEDKYSLATPQIDCGDFNNYGTKDNVYIKNVEEGNTLDYQLFIKNVDRDVTCNIKADPESSILALRVVQDNPLSKTLSYGKKVQGSTELTFATKSGKQSTLKENGTGSLYTTNETVDGSTVYYYRGNVKNNWVIFGVCTEDASNKYNCKKGDALYWRIIRTNTEAEGGGVRLIYSGSGSSKDSIPTDSVITEDQPSTDKRIMSLDSTAKGAFIKFEGEGEELDRIAYKTEDKHDFSSINGYIGKTVFNKPSTDSSFGPFKVTYMGTQVKDDPQSIIDNPDTNYEYNKLRTNETPSVVKEYIDEWYDDIFNEEMGDQGSTFTYGDFVNTKAIYCNNRTIMQKFEKDRDTGEYELEDKGNYYDNTRSLPFQCVKRGDKCKRDENKNIIWTDNKRGTIYFGSIYEEENDNGVKMARDNYRNSNPQPTLDCESVEDRFTSASYYANGTKMGNGDLTYPVALITVDEVYFAGALKGSSNNELWLNQDATYICVDKDKPCDLTTLERKCNIKGVKCKYEKVNNKRTAVKVLEYKYTGNSIIGNSKWWTMTPNMYRSSLYKYRETTKVYAINGKGNYQNNINTVNTYDEYFVRPVISLKYEVNVSSGNGTPEDPYVFSRFPHYVATVVCKNCKTNNGTITKSASVEAYKSQSFELTADEGYMIRRAKTSSNCHIGQTNISTGEVEFPSVSNNMTCTVEAVPLEYDLTVSGPVVSATDYSSARPGEGTSISFTLKEGYDPDTIGTDTAGCTITGSGATRTVSVSEMNYDKTCHITASKYTYKVTVNVTGGSSGPASYNVPWGEGYTFTISANDAYKINTLRIVSGDCTLDGNKVTVTNVKETRTCNLTMDKKTFTVRISITNGSTTSNNPQTVEYDGEASFTVSADSNYDITKMSSSTSACTISGSGTARTVKATGVRDNITCTVNIPIKTFTVTISCTNCSSNPSSATLDYGGSKDFTITMNTNYVYSSISSSGNTCTYNPSTRKVSVQGITQNTTCYVTGQKTYGWIYWANSGNHLVGATTYPSGVSIYSSPSTYTSSTNAFLRTYTDGTYVDHHEACLSYGGKYVCFSTSDASTATIQDKIKSELGITPYCGWSSNRYRCVLSGTSLVSAPRIEWYDNGGSTDSIEAYQTTKFGCKIIVRGTNKGKVTCLTHT